MVISTIRKRRWHPVAVLGYGRLDIRLLAHGPRLLVDGRPIDVGSPQTALSLAVLADSVGHFVSRTDLMDALWGQHPPRSAMDTLYSLMSRLRGVLRASGFRDVVVSGNSGYLLNVDPRCVDWHRLPHLLSAARESVNRGHRREAARLYEEALSLWDGDPLARVGGDWAEARRVKMRAHRLRVLTQWAQNALELGEYDEILDRLEDHPVQERLVHVRMRALEELKRDAEAIDCYHVLREHRLEHSGIEPNEQTRRLYEELIRREASSHRPVPSDFLPSAVTPGPDTEAAVVDTLPPDLGYFAVRERELRLILDGVEHNGTGTVVQVIRGMGGVGKTILAVHAAHHLRDCFDVRLHLDLRGLDAEQALFRLLTALGVPGETIPAGLDRRVEMWRAGTADRRVLLFLDDAVHGHVAPLVPASPGGAVLVTSRESLALELDGARDLYLRPLSDDDGIRMIAAFAGRSVEDEGIADLAAVLGNLPLALRLTAAQLRLHPGRGCRAHAERIVRNGLSEIRESDRSLTATFDISYMDLSPVARRVFLCAGLHPVANLRLPAVAAGTGGLWETEAAFEELLDRHLVEETADEVYRMHDLVRRFARERANEAMTEPERRAIDLRVLDHYLHTVDAADRAALPGRFRLGLPMIGRTAEQTFSGPKAARDWFVGAFADLDEVLSFAREQGYTAHTAWLPLAMAGLLEGCGPWDRAERALESAVEAWGELGVGEGVAHARYERGRIRRRLLDFDTARSDVDAARAWWESSGDSRGVAYAHDQAGMLYATAREHRTALEEHTVALATFRRLGDRDGQAQALNRLGLARIHLGDFEGAIGAFLEVGALGDDRVRAQAMLNEARIRLETGHHREARHNCETSLAIFEALGDRIQAAYARTNLGMVFEHLHRYEEALACFSQVREQFRRMRDLSGALRADRGAAAVLVGLGRFAEAQSTAEDALRRAGESGAREIEPTLLYTLGDVFLAMGRSAMARLQYRSARHQAHVYGLPAPEGLACDRLGDLDIQEGDVEGARALWREALRLLEPLGANEVTMIRIKLDVGSYVHGSGV
ncbi:AfsR/SARP family transcriptional regulator [Nocardiopsis protaetiae]